MVAPRSFPSRTLILFVFLYIALPSNASAGPTPNLTIGFTWGGTVITEGGTFDLPLSSSGVSQYTWPGGGAYGDLYRGVLGQGATIVAGHSLGSTGSKTEFSDSFSAEGDYFVVVYSIPPSIPNVRDWFMNGTTINPFAAPPDSWGIIKFKIGEPEVELYTQVISQYPSLEETQDWAGETYANGQGIGSCGEFISSCGCAISSAVMIARFYDITMTSNGGIDPLQLNDWLENNDGYISGGGVNWNKIAKYTDYRMKFTTRDETTNNFSLLDSFLTDNHPMIARADPGRGHASQHFFVIDQKLAGTYRVKDPRWYNTQTLNEPTTDHAANVRAYQNGFDALRGFVPHDGTPYASLVFALGSPAELLITDEHGRRLGKDPVSGIVYNDIPGGSYGSDDIGDPDGIVPPPAHRGKVAYLDNPPSGNFSVSVIGTGDGAYTLATTFTDTSGASLTHTATGTVHIGQDFNYETTFDMDNANASTIALSDQEPPVIIFIQPTTTTFTRVDTLPIHVVFDDDTGIASSSVTFDGTGIEASSTIDLFAQALGDHAISAYAKDLVNNEATSTKAVQIIATSASLRDTINRLFALGWIKNPSKVSLTTMLMQVERAKIPSLKITLYRGMLNVLDAHKMAGNVNQQAYDILTADINWLINN